MFGLRFKLRTPPVVGPCSSWLWIRDQPNSRSVQARESREAEAISQDHKARGKEDGSVWAVRGGAEGYRISVGGKSMTVHQSWAGEIGVAGEGVCDRARVRKRASRVTEPSLMWFATLRRRIEVELALEGGQPGFLRASLSCKSDNGQYLIVTICFRRVRKHRIAKILKKQSS